MTISEMLSQSGVMALFGMGIVFSFLIILVIAVSLMGKIIGSFEKNGIAVPAAAAAAGNDANIAAACLTTSSEVVTAISAAVNEYRKNK